MTSTKKVSERNYDLVVIGSGPAGVAAAVQASKLGKKVVIVEKDPKQLGGAWLHFGTIPSKTIREVLATVQNVKPHVGQGWVDRLVSGISSDSLLKRAQLVSDEEELLVRKHLENNNIDIVTGFGRVESRNSVRVIPDEGSTFVIPTEKIMVATGSRPRRPADVPFDGWRVVDSDGILSLETMPKSIVIFGAGVIGCEYACIFGALGVDTTLVDGRTQIMQSMDHEMTHALRMSMESLGVKFILGKRYKGIRITPSHAALDLEDLTIEAEVCFFAAGRVSTTSRLGLEEVGIEMNERGAILVNDYFQTSISSIYAAGDAIGPPALASTSIEQGRIAAGHAFGGSRRKFPKVFPVGIYTIPEMSSVGMSEEEVVAAGTDYVVGRANYDEVARGYIRGDNHGLLKLLVSTKDEKILGIHIFGADAANLIHIGQCCMLGDVPCSEIVNSIVFNYPTLAEAYRVAAFNAINKIPAKKKAKSRSKPSSAA